MESSLSSVLKRMKPYLGMIFLQFGYAGMFVIAVASLKAGMNHYVLVVYRNVVATIFMAPFAYWFERKVRTKMTMSCFLKISLLALLEPVIDQNCYYAGAKMTSASFSAALFNMLPAITFVIAVVFRMEKIRMKSLHSQAKIMGTLLTVAGALVMILYKGPILEFVWTRGRPHHGGDDGGQHGSDFIKGTLLLVVGCCSWSFFFILQSNVLKSYAAEMSLTTWICFMGSLESAAVALVMARGDRPWAIGWDMRMATAVYSGIMCSGVAYYVQGIVMKERGPVFVTAFNPLLMIIVAVLGSFLLAEDIDLGLVIGAVIIVVGLYSLIWGKSKDLEIEPLKPSPDKLGALELPISLAADNPEKRNVEEYITVVEIPERKP